MKNVKNNRINKNKIINIFLKLFAIFLLATTVLMIVFFESNSSRDVNVEINTTSQEIAVTSDEDLSEITIKLKITSKEYGKKMENIPIKELKAFETKKIMLENAIFNNQTVTITNIKYIGYVTTFEEILFFIIPITGAISFLSFIFALIIGYKQ